MTTEVYKARVCYGEGLLDLCISLESSTDKTDEEWFELFKKTLTETDMCDVGLELNGFPKESYPMLYVNDSKLDLEYDEDNVTVSYE
jgi:hypothetical protein